MKQLPSSPSRRRLQQSTRLGRVVPAVAVALFTLSLISLASAGVIVGPSDDEYMLDTAAINSAMTMSMTAPASGAAILSADGLVSSVSLGQIDPSLFPQICTYVDVLTSSGIPVTGLTADSFCVKQDGSAVGPFTVQQLTGDSCHTATCLVIDVSGSMANGGKMTAAKNAAIRFVRQMSIYDRTAVVKFSDCYTVVRNFTSDTTLLINSINALTSGGRTAYFDGVWKGTSLT
ncbi:MAG: VWA domain-containing protein, partial [candidate division Zixibacteria bacterium]|nr:VWA domain-containing protein [candidate division Zixibacteria bacterium]